MPHQENKGYSLFKSWYYVNFIPHLSHIYLKTFNSYTLAG